MERFKAYLNGETYQDRREVEIVGFVTFPNGLNNAQVIHAVYILGNSMGSAPLNRFDVIRWN